uniref:Uncharacterized protein n=1 Tax=viral metagenome TaxID=1070528 RepID=A0A6C0HLG8_9ZZZZ
MATNTQDDLPSGEPSPYAIIIKDIRKISNLSVVQAINYSVKCASTQSSYSMQNMSSNAIYIAHLLIGSYIPDGSAFDTTFERHHEFPMIVRRYFLDPIGQLSPQYLDNIADKCDHQFTIYQTLFLIDPEYNSTHNYKLPKQFVNEMDLIIRKIISNLEQPDVSDVSISFDGNVFTLKQMIKITPIGKPSSIIQTTSIIEVFIVPENIDESTITQTLTLAQELFAKRQSESHGEPELRSQCNFLLNIMDFTGSTIVAKRVVSTAKATADIAAYPDMVDKPISITVTSAQPNVFMTHPDCMMQDNQRHFIPVITLTDNGTATARWLNPIHDIDCIAEYAKTKDANPNSYNSWEYLTAAASDRFLKVEVLGLLKLWQVASLSSEISCDDIPIPSGFAFKDLIYGQFIEYSAHNSFIKQLTSRVGTYYKNETLSIIGKLPAILKIFAIDKCDYIANPLESHLTMCPLKDCVQLAAVTILRQMQTILPQLIDFEFNDGEVNILFMCEFLKMHGVYF